ncbi:MAG: DUF1569 domain-containing protein [Gemmatimonas sp.]|nr:DUF1569 domain-containing protein [Gemmatimonas sp.]
MAFCIIHSAERYMIDITAGLLANRRAVEELIQSAENSMDVWMTSRAPGKWSPSQLTEHVARSLDESTNVVAGRPTKFPTLPAFVRPITRGLLFKRVLKQGTFPKARTNKAMNPETGPATPEEARLRLETACSAFERECLAHAQRMDRLQTGIFGEVSIADFVRFTEIHTRHHNKQMQPPGAASRA